jgi:hypothetical protein
MIYRVLTLLYDRATSRFVEPGDCIELDDQQATILLAKGAIAPAPSPSEELSDDTDR